MGILMKKRKPESRKEPYDPAQLRKVSSDLQRMADKIASMADAMDDAKLDMIHVDGHQSLHERGYAAVLKFIAQVSRELAEHGIY